MILYLGNDQSPIGLVIFWFPSKNLEFSSKTKQDGSVIKPNNSYGHVAKKVKVDCSKEDILKELICTKKKVQGIERELKKKLGFEDRINQQLLNIALTSEELTRLVDGFGQKLDSIDN